MIVSGPNGGRNILDPNGRPLQINPDAWQSFRKRPVVIDAVRLSSACIVETLEGNMVASAGDWLIRGVAGEVYPCKDEIFQATYDAVKEA